MRSLKSKINCLCEIYKPVFAAVKKEITNIIWDNVGGGGVPSAVYDYLQQDLREKKSKHEISKIQN